MDLIECRFHGPSSDGWFHIEDYEHKIKGIRKELKRLDRLGLIKLDLPSKQHARWKVNEIIVSPSSTEAK
jgi:hypothetical protein